MGMIRNTKKRKKSALWAALRAVLMPVAAVVVLMFFSTALNELNGGRSDEDLRQLEETLRRACVACFAAEGEYPQDIAYLEEHYGVQIDPERYVVRYDAFAQNLMPDITVLELKP